MRSLLLLGVLAALPAAPALAQPPPVQIADARARATAPGQTVGAAYATLTSPAADRLVGAETPVAARAAVHTMTMDGAVMRMRPVDSVPLPAGQAVALAPGGLHIMLTGLKAPLKAGQDFPLTLRFEHAPPLTVAVHVEPLGVRAAGKQP